MSRSWDAELKCSPRPREYSSNVCLALQNTLNERCLLLEALLLSTWPLLWLFGSQRAAPVTLVVPRSECVNRICPLYKQIHRTVQITISTQRWMSERRFDLLLWRRGRGKLGNSWTRSTLPGVRWGFACTTCSLYVAWWIHQISLKFVDRMEEFCERTQNVVIYVFGRRTLTPRQVGVQGVNPSRSPQC